MMRVFRKHKKDLSKEFREIENRNKEKRICLLDKKIKEDVKNQENRVNKKFYTHLSNKQFKER